MYSCSKGWRCPPYDGALSAAQSTAQSGKYSTKPGMASGRRFNHHDAGKEEDLMSTTIHEATPPELLKSWDGALTPMVPWNIPPKE
jgi:hypothetical protein